MRKHFILSTRTLVSKRGVTQSFGPDNTVYVPLSVIEEIETKYSDRMDERGKIAREILAYLGEFHINDLKKGVVQANGSILKVTINYSEEKLPDDVEKSETSKLDKRILKTCLGIKREVPEGEPVVLVSKKSSLRKKAEMLGVKAQTFRDELLPEISEQYTGRKTIKVSEETISNFLENGEIPLSEVVSQEKMKDIYPNLFIVFRGDNYSHAYGRVYQDKIVKLTFEKTYPYRAMPKNEGQKFLVEALMMDYSIAPLVIVKGPAGTGKTFLTLAAGLEQIEQGEYSKKILISRAPVETGEKIGYLPGDEEEKMGPYIRGIRDNLEELLNLKDSHKNSGSNKNSKKNKLYSDGFSGEKPSTEDGSYFFERGDIKLEAIGFIRGRNITNTYIVIDEVQNLTPVEVKTIITRVSEGTKLILMGDPAQIDRPELDERSNGLSFASERLKGEPTCWQVTMTDEESVRSELAKRASILL